MSFITEHVICGLRPGADPRVVGSPAAEKMKEACQTLSQQRGFVRQYWGVKMEDPATIVWSIDWESLQHHQDFVNSETYGPFAGGIGETLMDFVGPPKMLMYHTEYTAEVLEARQAPVTEYCYFALPADANDEQKAALEDALLNLVKVIKTKVPTVTYAVGWIIEPLDNPASSDGKSKVFSGMLGWESREQHLKMREDPDFPALIQPIRELALQPSKELTVFHSALQGKRT